MAESITARSIVRLTIEVQHIGGCWGGDCTVAQAHQQAVDSAVAVVAGALLSAREGKPRIIGVTSVDVVVTKEDGRG